MPEAVCPMPSLHRILEARIALSEAHGFVSGGDPVWVIEPSPAFYSGALGALDWLLGLGGGHFFELHLESLARIERGGGLHG